MSEDYTFPLSLLLATDGVFPNRGADGASTFTLGMVQTMAPALNACGAPDAHGQSLPVARYQMLFSAIGMNFGGNPTSFRLPDLKGRSAAGSKFFGMETNDSLALNWLIAPDTFVGTPPVGCLIPFAGNYCPEGWMIADGATLSTSANAALFVAIGNRFGGDGQSNFKLPDMTGRVAFGAGTAGGTTIEVGAAVAGAVPGVGLNLIIAIDGIYPTTDGSGAFPGDQRVLGQIVAYAGSDVPKGWALCNGAHLPIATHKPLFQLIGTRFGGDGTTDFALPDLRCKRIVGR